MTTWLVTGVTGFLGANAALMLRGLGDVVGLARTAQDLPWCSNVVIGDLTEPDSLRRAVDVVQPDIVLHCAALASHDLCERDPDLAEAINVTGTQALLSHTGETPFIYISTDTVFSGSRGGWMETDAVRPVTAYGRTKAQAEEIVLKSPNPLVVRTNFFGWSPSGHRSILEFFVEGLSRGDTIPGFTDYRVSSIFAHDLVSTIIALSASEERGVFHVSSSNTLSKYEFGLAVAKVFGLDPDLIKPAVSPVPDRDLSLCCERVERLLGAPMPTQETGIERARVQRPNFEE